LGKRKVEEFTALCRGEKWEEGKKKKGTIHTGLHAMFFANRLRKTGETAWKVSTGKTGFYFPPGKN